MPATATPNPSVTHPPCAPRSLCRRWRTCVRCGAIRQARLADLAERLAAYYPEPWWTVLRPIDPATAALARARHAWATLTRTPAAIWTIEASPRSAGLHINLIHPPHPAVNLSQAHAWSQPIRGNLRHVAAYIIDPRKAPQPAAYAGRLHGTMGPLWYILSRASAFPAVQAAAIQFAVDPTPMQSAAALARSRERADPALSPDEYRRIAARYLPALLEATASAEEKTRSE